MKEQSTILRKGTSDLTAFVRVLLTWLAQQDVMVTFEDVKKERTNLQNKALWGCAYEAIRKATGNDKENLHEYFCGEYWGWEIKTVMGMKKKQPKRTTTTDYDGKRDVISTKHLSDFYAFIQMKASEVAGVYVPDPDPRWWVYAQEKAA